MSLWKKQGSDLDSNNTGTLKRLPLPPAVKGVCMPARPSGLFALGLAAAALVFLPVDLHSGPAHA